MTTGIPSERDVAMKLIHAGSFGDSIQPLLSAIEEEPKDVDLHLYLGLAYAKAGDLDRAIEILEDTVDIAPTNAKTHYNLGVAYQMANNITQAKDAYLRALGFDANYTAPKQALDYLMNMKEQD